MKKLSRRDFLKVSALGFSALVAGSAFSYYRSEKNYLRRYKDVQFVKPGSSPTRVILTNGHFVDVHTGRLYENVSSLVIENGKIAALPGLPGQPSAGIDAGDAAEIDLQGRTVIPALFNTHCHIQNVNPGFTASGWGSMIGAMGAINVYAQWQRAKGLADCLARGITHVRDAWAEDLSINYKFQQEIERGEIPGPRIYQSVLVSPLGGPFAPERGWMDNLMWRAIGLPSVEFDDPKSGVVTFAPGASQAEVRAAVDQAIDERGAAYIKIYDQKGKRFTNEPGAVFMTIDQMAAITDQAHRRGLYTLSHHIETDCLRRGVQTGTNSLSHFPMDVPLTDADIEAFVRSGTVLEPTMSIAYAGCWKSQGKPWEKLPIMDRLEDFRNRNYHSLAEDYWVEPLQERVIQVVDGNRPGVPNPGMDMILNFFANVLTIGRDNIRRLIEAGAVIACGNDAGAAQGTAAAVPLELALIDLFYNEPGQAPLIDSAEMLRIATINSARAMGLEGNFGSIEHGKTADLVILDENPLEDPGAIGSIAAAVFKNGQLAVNNCGLVVTPAAA